MSRTALWCVLSLAAAGCTLIGDGELEDKPAEDGSGGAPAATGTTSGVTASGAAQVTTSAGSGPGSGGAPTDCQPACSAGSICKGGSCACESPKPPPAQACPGQCNAGCDEGKGICRIERVAPCSASCPETIVCPPGMECEVRCKGTQACYEATIRCPESFACRVECDGDQVCKSSHLVGATGALTLTCKDYQPCQDMDLDCGAGSCVFPCTNFGGNVVCGDSCNCDGC